MISFSFLYPTFLWFLLFIPVFIFVYMIALTKNKQRGIAFGNFRAIERFYGVEFFSKNFIYMYLNIFILILLIFGLAGFGVNTTAKTSDADFVVAIDTSTSMLTSDIEPTRFDAAVASAKNLISRLPAGTNVGIIGFSGASVIYQDLTNDKILQVMGLGNIKIGEVDGTNIYDALLLADKMLDMYDTGKKRNVILISDGQINVGDAALIIDFAQRNNIIIYTIGVGTKSDEYLNMISSADINFLKSLSFNTGGKTFLVDSGDFSEFLNEFGANGKYDVTLDLSMYLIIFAILLFFISWVLYNFRFRIYP